MNQPFHHSSQAGFATDDILPKPDFSVVGIGASAGGLQALIRFFEQMPAENRMAFVVILHLSPQHESNADAVLQRVTRMPVVLVTEPLCIEPNHVYVIPPDRHLSMNGKCLCPVERERPRGQHVAIDLFFRALAEAHRERAVGIVLSGTGADGAVGLARMKETGGVTMAQTPGDAEHDGMPLAAIGAGVVDFVLPVVEMPQKLIDLDGNARRLRLPPAGDPEGAIVLSAQVASDAESEKALHDVLVLLRRHTGHDFRHYKRATVLRRIERRMQVRGVATLPDYRALLEVDGHEGAALLKDMLIGVTNFFRDREAFDALEREVLPQLFHGKESDSQVRAWAAACSSGEEAYSLAMLLSDYAATLPTQPGIQVFATDLDERAIAIARSGVYPASIVTDVPPAHLRQFFIKEDDHYRVRKLLRDTVLFAVHNLLRDPPFSRLDLISCRNLLIYLNREVQTQVLEMFHFALNPGGFLFLGSSESADALGHFFTPVDKKNRLYRARALSRPARPASALPVDAAARSPLPDPHSAARRKFSFSEVHQRVLAQYAPPSVLLNQDTNIVYMSDRAGRFLRHIGGEPSRNLVALVLPELRGELRTALFQAWQSRKSVEARRVELKRDGHSYYVNMVARPFHDDDAGADFVLVLFDEVEHTMGDAVHGGNQHDAVLRQLEEELQRTKEQLQETIEQAEVSTEELRASNEELQAINEELRSATEELETSKEELQSVNEELITVNYELKMKVEETGKVNDDLLDLSRVNTGKLAMTDLDLAATAAAIVGVMQADPAAAALRMTLAAASPAWIRADPVRVEQVLLNLLSNAVKFTPAGGAIEVKVAAEEGMARLDVSDSGQGIAPAFLPQVFDMFGQAGAATTRRQGGLGIGLTLVRHIAQLHGGRVEAASAGIGCGARFSVWFPLQDSPACNVMQRRGSDNIAGLTILLVDDVADVVDSVGTLLELEGATVHTARSAAEALGLLARQHVDLLVSDIAMQEMDGYAFIAEVRKRIGLDKLPAIAVSGMSRLQDVARAHAAGFNAHLGKPASIDALVRTAIELCPRS